VRYSARELEAMLTDKAGLERLEAFRVREQDAIEFKVRIEHRDPKAKDELRRDCAALASAGVGFLVVGVDETRDGTNAARKAIGVVDAPALAASIEDTLGTGLSPPIVRRHVWTVAIDDERSVVVARVEGRQGYPIEVYNLRELPRHFVREAGKKRPLNPEEARVRREALEVTKRWLVPIIAALIVVGSVSVYAWYETARATATAPFFKDAQGGTCITGPSGTTTCLPP
jgi:hypothetical protein